MSIIEELLPFLFQNIGGETPNLRGSFFQNHSGSMSSATCNGSSVDACRDESYARVLKFVAFSSILVAGLLGVAIPLVGKKRRFLQTDSNVFVAAKAFAAGVILATGFVHILHDARSALTNHCLPQYPWSKFPFSEFFAMMAALATLLADFVGTQYFERKQERQKLKQAARVDPIDSVLESGNAAAGGNEGDKKLFGEEDGGRIHIVGIHAQTVHHMHHQVHGEEDCCGNVKLHSHRSSHSHSHSHGFDEEDDEEDEGRHVIVSQVLELGVVSHSIIIGLSLGVSQSPCTIRPLIGALSFHQLFEGFALGGCFAQAKFETLHSTLMAGFFAITAPLGIAIGLGVTSSYNPNSPGALVVEGILDSFSAGILVYMALVDLIAADFLSKRMRRNVRLQVVSYLTLILGALLMSCLALWA